MSHRVAKLRASHAEEAGRQAAARAEQEAVLMHARVAEAERRAHPRRPEDFAALLAELAAWHQQAGLETLVLVPARLLSGTAGCAGRLG